MGEAARLAEPGAEAESVLGNWLESPPDLGDDAEGPFRSDDQIEKVRGFEIGIEGVAGGVLANLGKGRGDPPSRQSEGVGQRRVEAPGHGGVGWFDAPIEPDDFGIGGDHGQALDPATD